MPAPGQPTARVLADGAATYVQFHSTAPLDRFPDTGLTCRQVWAYPPQRRGARLTLAIRSFAATSNGAVANAVGTGPWQLPMVIP